MYVDNGYNTGMNAFTDMCSKPSGLRALGLWAYISGLGKAQVTVLQPICYTSGTIKSAQKLDVRLGMGNTSTKILIPILKHSILSH